MRRLIFGRSALVALWLLATSLVCAPVSAEQNVPFSVFLGGVQIGTYAITASNDGDQKQLKTATDLHVGLGPITLHRLQQNTHEVWENGKLVRLDAWTEENGGETEVAARVKAGDLVVDGPNGPAVARGSVATLPTLILGDTSRQLIDPKNGLLLPIVFEKKTSRDRARDDKSSPAGVEAFSIRGGITADVWRDRQGVILMIVKSDGVALEFRRPDSNFVPPERPAWAEIRLTNLLETLR